MSQLDMHKGKSWTEQFSDPDGTDSGHVVNNRTKMVDKSKNSLRDQEEYQTKIIKAQGKLPEVRQTEIQRSNSTTIGSAKGQKFKMRMEFILSPEPKSIRDYTVKRRCIYPGCTKYYLHGRLCIAHGMCLKYSVDFVIGDKGGGKKCSIVGCNTVVQSLGLCKAHGSENL